MTTGMGFETAIRNAAKRLAVTILAVFVFGFAIFSLFQGWHLFSIILHLVGFGLIYYVVRESMPEQ